MPGQYWGVDYTVHHEAAVPARVVSTGIAGAVALAYTTLTEQWRQVKRSRVGQSGLAAATAIANEARQATVVDAHLADAIMTNTQNAEQAEVLPSTAGLDIGLTWPPVRAKRVRTF